MCYPPLFSGPGHSANIFLQCDVPDWNIAAEIAGLGHSILLVRDVVFNRPRWIRGSGTRHGRVHGRYLDSAPIARKSRLNEWSTSLCVQYAEWVGEGMKGVLQSLSMRPDTALGTHVCWAK